MALLATIAILGCMFSARSAQAASGTWTVDADGDWSTASNWQSSVIADGSGFTADFSQLDITANRTVTLDGDRTIGSLTFGDTGGTVFNWTIGNGGVNTRTLTLAGGTPTIHTATAGQTVTLGVRLAGTSGLTKTGAGMLVLNQSNAGLTAGTISILHGTLQVAGFSTALGSRPVTLGDTGGANSATLDVAVSITSSVTVTSGNTGTMTIRKSDATSANSTLSGGITLSKSVTFDVGSGLNLNIGTSGATGIISGTGGITKDGLGSLTLFGTAASGTYSGGTTLNAGTIVLGNNNVLGSGTLTITGGTLSTSSTTSRTFTNAMIWNDDFTVMTSAASGAISASGGVTVNGTRTVTTGPGFTLTLSGVVSGDGIVKEGDGTLVLSASNSYTGGTIIRGGTLAISGVPSGNPTDNNRLGDASNGVTFDGGTLQLIGAGIRINRAITLSAGGGIISTTASGNPGMTFGGTISGSGGLTKTGTGVLRLDTVDKTFTGDVYILQGILESSVGLVGDGSNSGDMYILGGSYQFNNSMPTNGLGTNNIVYVGDTTGSTDAGFTKVNNGSQTTNSDLWVRFSPDGGSRFISFTSGDGRSVTFNGTVTLDTALTISISQGGDGGTGSRVVFNGAIQGDGGFIKAGSHTGTRLSSLILNNTTTIASTYTGATIIDDGIVTVSTSNSLPATTAVSLATGAFLDLTAMNASTFSAQTLKSLAGAGTVSIGSGTGLTLTIGNTGAADAEFSGTLSFTATNNQLIKADNYTQTLSGTNSLFAGVTIAAGTLSTGVIDNLGNTATGNITLSGGTLRWTGNSESISATRVIATSSSLTAIEVTTATATFAISPNLTGAGNLTKLGDGRLELAGAANTYEGTTTVTAGTLHINGTLTSGGGVVSVGTAGTLQGSGLTSILRNVTVTGNGTLSFAGGAIGGTLTATGGNWTGNGSVGGVITVNPGTFTISSGSTLTASGLTTINSSGVLNLGGTLSGSASLAGGTITGSGGTITGTLAVSGGAWSGTGTVSGAVTASSGTFEVLNSATLNNTTAATVTGSATLSVNGVVSGAVIVQSGGTLHGNGTIGGPVTVNDGGFMSAGNSVGHLTVDDNLTWNSGSNQVFEISDADMLGTPGTDWDLITVNGELTLNATPSSKINLTFDSWPPGDPLDNFDALDSYSWLWITTTGGIDVGSFPVNNLFNFILGPEFAGDFPLVDVDNFSVSIDGLNMYVNYTVVVVPEPSTLLLASLAAVGLGAYSRRRRLQAASQEPS